MRESERVPVLLFQKNPDSRLHPCSIGVYYKQQEGKGREGNCNGNPRLQVRDAPSPLYSRPKDGFACAGKGGTIDGLKYCNFVYCINRLDRETADDLDYLYLKAEER